MATNLDSSGEGKNIGSSESRAIGSEVANVSHTIYD